MIRNPLGSLVTAAARPLDPEPVEAAPTHCAGCRAKRCEGVHVQHVDDRTEAVVDVLRVWHDDHHDGPFRFCMAEPCYPVLRAAEAVD